MSIGTIPFAFAATKGFEFTGLAVYARNHKTGYSRPVWSGEFHGMIGDGKASEFLASTNVTVASDGGYWVPVCAIVSNHRTGESREVSMADIYRSL